MRDFPSCFGENGVQIADSSSSTTSRNAQNLVTSVYQCRFMGQPCFISITWTRNVMGQGLTIAIDGSDNHSICKVDIKPWLFSKRKGSRQLEVNSTKLNIYWDLTNAKFGSSPEPLEGFYIAVMLNQKLVLLIGDMKKEAYNKTEFSPTPSIKNAIFISRKEHIFGKKLFVSKVQFCEEGTKHDIAIECDTVGVKDPSLVIRIDNKTVMKVKRLKWKFRGNYTILIDGFAVEVFWDVHNWLFGNGVGNAMFVFQTCHLAQKSWASQSVLDSSGITLSDSLLRTRDFFNGGLGFSLVLCAWKSE